MTNKERIQQMTDEELAEYLFDRGNGCEYCYGICAYQDECDGHDHAQEFCISEIVKWLNQEEHSEWDDYDHCYECRGLGDDYIINDDGGLESYCDKCGLNPNRLET